MIQEHKNIDLTSLNSFRVRVRAERVVDFESTEDLSVLFADSLASPAQDANGWRVFSGGNNVLFSSDFRGTLLHPVSKNIEQIASLGDQVTVRADAGVEWDDLVGWSVERGLWGIENLSLIPGYVGAAPVQNIGAYGVEVKDVVVSVEMFSPQTGTHVVLSADHCAFGYRDSVFKSTLKNRVIITAVNIKLTKTEQPRLDYGDLRTEVERRGGATLKNIREAVIDIRRTKLPDPAQLGNAGSFFKNPVVEQAVADKLKAQYADMPSYPAGENRVKLAAGWLIDRCGLKGYRSGNVGVHASQALVLVNYGGADGAEVLALASHVTNTVKKQFGVEIDMEVNIW